MKDYMKNHEEYIRELLSAGERDPAEILRYHNRQIEHMQQERLMHLLVMFLTVVVFIFSSIILYVIQSLPAAFLWIVLLVLTFFYIRHYYFLENTVQRWYRLANRLEREVTGLSPAENVDLEFKGKER